jgi:hypothetical protein
LSDEHKSLADAAHHYLSHAQHQAEEKAHYERESQRASIETAQFSAKQMVLLNEVNVLAKKAYAEAEFSRKETVKATKRAFWANFIAVLSLFIAAGSLILSVIQYFANGT